MNIQLYSECSCCQLLVNWCSWQLWPFTTFVLFLERNMCAGKLTSHVITEAEASDKDKLMDSKMHSADDGIVSLFSGCWLLILGGAV